MVTKTIFKAALALFASFTLFFTSPVENPDLYEPIDGHLHVIHKRFAPADGQCNPGMQNLMVLTLQVENSSSNQILSEITPKILFINEGKAVSISPIEGRYLPGERFIVVAKILTPDCDPDQIEIRFKGESTVLPDPILPDPTNKGDNDNGDNDNDNEPCDDDEDPPVALCDNISVFLDVNGLAEITADQIDGGSYDNNWIVDMSVSPKTFDCSDLGVNIVTLTVEDCFGLTDQCTATVTVVDAIPPAIHVYALDKTVECDGSGNQAELQAWLANNGGATATDACGPVTWTNDYTAITNGCSNSNPTGVAQVNFIAADPSGNTKTVGATFLIVDTQAPVLTCPTQVIQSSSPNGCGAKVFYTVTVTDDCDATPTLNCQLPSGSWFPVGTTQVSCTATDACGNDAICFFPVVVQDVESPMLTCYQDTTINLVGCVDSIYLAFPEPPHSDNCGIQSITNDYTGTNDASAYYFPGTTVVTWLVTDINGLTTSCSHIVTVVGDSTTMKVCDIDPVIYQGDGIYAAAVAPLAGTTFHQDYEPIPLIVTAKDFDQILQTCRCLCTYLDGTPIDPNNPASCETQTVIEIRDQVSYSWQILSGPGTLRSTDRQATILDPPVLGMVPLVTVIEVTIGDSRNNDSLTTVEFTINWDPEGPCNYTRTVSISIPPIVGNPITAITDSCDCEPQPPVWTIGDTLDGQITGTLTNTLQACAESKILIFADGDDSDSLRLECAGGCGIDSADFDLVDELEYVWTAHGGIFPDYGGGTIATSNSTQSAVIWEAPATTGPQMITVEIYDSHSQFTDPTVRDTIYINVMDVEIDFTGVDDADETCIGGILCLNDDDDNLNAVEDRNEAGTIHDENELLPITIDKQPGVGNVDIAITYSGMGRIDMWEDSLKTTPALLTYPASAMPLELWVEGVEASIDPLDILVTVSCGSGLPCADSLRLTVISVVEVNWTGFRQRDGQTNFFQSGNPAQYGGGDQIYPGRNYLPGTPGGLDDLHNKVNLNAVLSSPLPIGSKITINFRLFDPDHYSNDPLYDLNGTLQPEDNVEAGDPDNPDLSIGALLYNLSTSQPDTAIEFTGLGSVKTVTAVLDIGHPQPGNNWIAIADCKGDALTRVHFGFDGKTLLSIPGFLAPAWPATKQSPLLTVWRKLYYEFDRMEDPNFDLDDPGRSRFLSGQFDREELATGRVYIDLPGTVGIVPSQPNQFAEGWIELWVDDGMGGHNWESDSIVASGTNPDPWVQVLNGVGGVDAWRNLRDDDITNYSVDKIDVSEDMGPSYLFDLWTAKLEPGLITPIDTSTQINNYWDTDVDFNHHLGDDGTDAQEIGEVRSVIAANKGAASSQWFWLVYQLGAFQTVSYLDNDRNDGNVASGLSLGSLTGWPFSATSDADAGTIVYAETAREWAENTGAAVTFPHLMQFTSIHEVGHQFDLEHIQTHGSLMTQSPGGPGIGLTFGPRGFRYMMMARQPGFNVH